jgi:metal-responsive CopG/Arc/MetJ family transcriptional regulator
VQVNVRLSDELIALVDELADESGRSRPEVVRVAIEELGKQRQARRVAEQYRLAYTASPQSPAELAAADVEVDRAIAAEPWEPWW